MEVRCLITWLYCPYQFCCTSRFYAYLSSGSPLQGITVFSLYIVSQHASLQCQASDGTRVQDSKRGDVVKAQNIAGKLKLESESSLRIMRVYFISFPPHPASKSWTINDNDLMTPLDTRIKTWCANSRPFLDLHHQVYTLQGMSALPQQL